MTRKEAFEALKDHAWFCRVVPRLKGDAKKLAYEFLEKHQDKSHDEFIFHVNRMFLDFPNKPNGWEVAMELLTAASVSVNNMEKKKSEIGF